MKITINGSNGRMGQAVALAADDEGIEVVGRCDLGGDLKVEAQDADVIIDFSFHETTEAVIETAKEMGKRLVIGTTGHKDERRPKYRLSGPGIIQSGSTCSFS
jgi:dihydrodipicolinate reductase